MELFFTFMRRWTQGEPIEQPGLAAEGAPTLPELEQYYRKLDLYFSFAKAFGCPVDADRLYDTRERVAEDINDILNMTVNEALDFFNSLTPNDITANILRRLQPLKDVGLEYLVLGQPSSTLSGGEAQRVKLADFLAQDDDKQRKLFIFDEPTTGLHFHDIHKLYDAFNRLIEHGNTVLVIEHNTELIKCADWIIDLGPEGGDGGGEVVFEGTPEELVKCKKSYTAEWLREKVE